MSKAQRVKYENEELESTGAKYTCKQLQHFRHISKCEKCMHYVGCPFWMTVLLLNNERAGPFMQMMLPSIEKPCLMFVKHPLIRNGDTDARIP